MTGDSASEALQATGTVAERLDALAHQLRAALVQVAPLAHDELPEWLYDGFLMTEEKATGIAPATSEWSYDADFRRAASGLASLR